MKLLSILLCHVRPCRTCFNTFDPIFYSTDAFNSAFDNVGDLFLTCQLCAMIEIINPILRIVNTGVVAPLIQVSLLYS